MKIGKVGNFILRKIDIFFGSVRIKKKKRRNRKENMARALNHAGKTSSWHRKEAFLNPLRGLPNAEGGIQLVPLFSEF